MSPKQKSLYWRTWSVLCAEFDWRHGDADRRHALHLAAGCPASSTVWENPEMDRYLAYARALVAGKKTGGERIVDEAGERRRLEWRIQKDLKDAGLDLSYVGHISTQMYGLGCWSLLSIDQLTNLRDIIHNRTRGRRAANKKPPGATRPQTPSKPRAETADCPF